MNIAKYMWITSLDIRINELIRGNSEYKAIQRGVLHSSLTIATHIRGSRWGYQKSLIIKI